MNKNNSYEELDEIFNKLYNKYGFDEVIIDAKQNIIKIIDKLIDYDFRNNEITSQLKKKCYNINEEGFIVSL
jgi:hypothetical protein